MGADNDPLAVLDGALRVRGVQNLRVADASAMPAITSGNTQAPTVMIAEKAAEMMLS
jgi:choline dehydrogenase